MSASTVRVRLRGVGWQGILAAAVLSIACSTAMGASRGVRQDVPDFSFVSGFTGSSATLTDGDITLEFSPGPAPTDVGYEWDTFDPDDAGTSAAGDAASAAWMFNWYAEGTGPPSSCPSDDPNCLQSGILDQVMVFALTGGGYAIDFNQCENAATGTFAWQNTTSGSSGSYTETDPCIGGASTDSFVLAPDGTVQSTTWTAAAATVPEPGTVLLLAGALAGMLCFRRADRSSRVRTTELGR